MTTRKRISIYDYPEHLNPFSEIHVSSQRGKKAYNTWSSKLTKKLNRPVSWIEKSWLNIDESSNKNDSKDEYISKLPPRAVFATRVTESTLHSPTSDPEITKTVYAASSPGSAELNGKNNTPLHTSEADTDSTKSDDDVVCKIHVTPRRKKKRPAPPPPKSVPFSGDSINPAQISNLPDINETMMENNSDTVTSENSDPVLPKCKNNELATSENQHNDSATIPAKSKGPTEKFNSVKSSVDQKSDSENENSDSKSTELVGETVTSNTNFTTQNQNIEPTVPGNREDVNNNTDVAKITKGVSSVQLDDRLN